jgi:Flp pilus assembly protein TadB
MKCLKSYYFRSTICFHEIFSINLHEKKMFKSLIFVLLSIAIWGYPLSISAAIYQKQFAQKTSLVFEKKNKPKQSFLEKFMQKRVGKILKKQTKQSPEEKKPQQPIGLIAMLFMFLGVIILLLGSKIGFLLNFIAFILSIISLIFEENPIYARRAFWFSLLICLYFLAKYFKVF